MTIQQIWHSKRQLFIHSFRSLFAEFLNKGAIVLVTIAVARGYGATLFGIFSYWGLIIGCLMVIADVGLTQYLTREFAHRTTQGLISTSVYIKIIATLLVSIVLLGIVAWILPHYPYYQLLIRVLLYNIGNVRTERARALIRAKKLIALELKLKCVQALGLLCCLPPLFWHWPLAQCIALQALSSWIVVCYGIWLIRNYLIAGRGGSLDPIFLLRKSIPFALGTLSITLYYFVDSLLLQQYYSFAVVGIYSAVYKIIYVFFLSLHVGGTLMMPHLMTVLQRQGKKIFHREITHLLLIVWCITSFLIACIRIEAHAIVALLYGAGYAGGGSILRILLGGLCFSSLTTIFIRALNTAKQQRSFMYITTLGLLRNGIVNLRAIPRFGMQGAAWTMVSSEMIMLIVARILYRHFLRQPDTITHE